MNRLAILTLTALVATAASADAADEYPMIRDTRKMRGTVTFVNAQRRVKVADGLASRITSRS